MIKELSAFGKQLREKQAGDRLIHDAIKDEVISTDLLIKEDGSFYRFQSVDNVKTQAEAILSKKGEARLLLDKAEEVLRFDSSDSPDDKSKKATMKKYLLFLKKLEKYKTLNCLEPIFLFYDKNSKEGVDKARLAFTEQKETLNLTGNITFRFVGENERIHEKKEVMDCVISVFETKQKKGIEKSSTFKCSICSTNNYPITKEPHEKIKNVPKGQSAGCALVSYNETAFESYKLIRNLNSAICTHCARLYVEGLNVLLSDGQEIPADDKKIKYYKYNHRKNLGKDTAVIYWTRDNQKVNELDSLEEPDEEIVGELIHSVASGNEIVEKIIEEDIFYSCTLSGAAARIAVRDWLEISLREYRRNIARWFEDIKIVSFNDLKYSSLYALSRSTTNVKVSNDTTQSRVASYLWKSAIKGIAPPLWILSAVLKRIRIVQSDDEKKKFDSFTKERAALIRLVLNRNFNKQNGGYVMNERLDFENRKPAYLSGRIFAVLEQIQQAALGKDLNAGIRDRFFSFASTTPSPAFGRLMKLSQNHLSKLRSEKPGYAVNLDKELQDLCVLLPDFPVSLSLEEQGQFALGYYHQKHESYAKAAEKKMNQKNNEEVENE